MEEYVPGQVYENLVKMMKYRNLNMTSVPLDADAVIQKLNHYEFVTLTGDRPVDDPRGGATVIIILIAPGSKFANKSIEFKKLLKGLPKTKAGENIEVVFVSDSALTIHIKKHIISYRNEHPKTHIEDYDYSIFKIETPLHESVPPHFIATADETREFCERHFTTVERFPKILQSDAQAVWLGLRPGMTVRVERISENAGTAIVYRYCTK